MRTADAIVNTHKFAPRHRSIVLRDEYRIFGYGMGAAAFNRGTTHKPVDVQSVLKPPVTLG